MAITNMQAHGIVEMAKKVYRDKHSGGCKILSKGDLCDCVLCQLDDIHATIDKEAVPSYIPTPPNDVPEDFFTQSGIELTNEVRRKETAEALHQLWKAIGLGRTSQIVLPGELTPMQSTIYQHLYFALGHMLLGKDCPDHEVLT